MLLAITAFLIGAILFQLEQGGSVHFDPTISLTTILQVPVLAGLWYVVRFISIQKDFPPHRHVNGHVLYPKGYAPEIEGKSKGASA